MNEEKERADFEAALIAGCWVKAAPKRDAAGTYITDIFDAAWWAWQARAALAAQGVPAGWKLAPAEPSEAMFAAFTSMIDGGPVFLSEFLRAYRAMLAATPAPTVKESLTTAPEATGSGPVDPLNVDCIGLALDLEVRAKKVDSQTTQRAMEAAANGLRLLAAAPAAPAQAQQAEKRAARVDAAREEMKSWPPELLRGMQLQGELTPSQRMAAAGFTARDTRMECDYCGKKVSAQLLPVHKCKEKQAQQTEAETRATASCAGLRPFQAQQADTTALLSAKAARWRLRAEAIERALAAAKIEAGRLVAELEKAHEARRQAQSETEYFKAQLARARLTMLRELKEQGWAQTATKAEPLTDDRIELATAHVHMNAPLARWVIAREVEKACAEAWGVKLAGIGASSGGAS